jgi:hypothetical protein
MSPDYLYVLGGILYLSGFFCRYSNTLFENNEAKASEVVTTENERKYYIPPYLAHTSKTFMNKVGSWATDG